VLRAAYKDRGANGLPGISSEQTYTLRNAKIGPHDFDQYVDINKMSFGGNSLSIPSKSGAYMSLNQIDLSNINTLNVTATAPIPQLNAAGGKIEVRLDGPKGKLIGESEFLEASEKMGFTPSQLKISLAPVDGIHDVYLVFQNPKAEGRSLMVVTGLEFKNETMSQPEVPKEINTPKVGLSDYQGKYKMTGLPFEYINVNPKDGKLIMEAGGQVGEISPTSTPDKYDGDGKAMIYFIRDDKQKVISLKMEAMGFNFEGKKEMQ
ncbi:MAG: carbohydrate-binding protein, partial [Saprospiraceae bacterium]